LTQQWTWEGEEPASGQAGASEALHGGQLGLHGVDTPRAVKSADREAEVIWKQVDQGKADEAKRSALLFVTLWDTRHGRMAVLDLPDDTLYSGSIVMPMIARSSGYQLTFTAIAVKMVVLNVACIALQFGLIVSFYHSLVVLPGLDGTPNICTYGQDVGKRHTPHGPLGFPLERNRGNIETDYTRVMVRNTLYEVMKKVNVTNNSIGPVELGMESATCRTVCIGVFCVAICAELFSIHDLIRFLLNVPTEAPGDPNASNSAERGEEALLDDEEDKPGSRAAGRWITFSQDAKIESLRQSWHETGRSNLDSVRFKACAMPMSWKVFGSAMLVAHIFIVVLTFWNGLSFLMNTGGIVDLVLNTLSLTFILDLDRLLFFTLARGITKEILKRVEPLMLHDSALTPLKQELENRQDKEQRYTWCMLFGAFISNNLTTIVLALVTVGGHYLYFTRFCVMKHWPFLLDDVWGESYFVGVSRYFGGWEFLFGGWFSKPVKDASTGNITCMPYNPLNNTPASGCSLPSA